MDPEDNKFGQGPRELTGAVDLISHFKLLPHHEFFCKRSLPLAISDTHYLHDVVGDTDIRKGEGMQLGQLVQNASFTSNSRIQPFDVNILRDAFQLRESAPVDLPLTEKGVPTISVKSKSESKDKEKKHKKHKDRDKEKDRDRDKEKDREHKKHKHRHKDRSKDRDKEKKEKIGHHDSGVDLSKKHHEKKRKHEGDEDLLDHRQKKSKLEGSLCTFNLRYTPNTQSIHASEYQNMKPGLTKLSPSISSTAAVDRRVQVR